MSRDDTYSKGWRQFGLPKLKPCPLPFCDGEGQFNQTDEPLYIFCGECGLTLDNEFSGGEYGCIELWNARTNEEVEVLFALGQYFSVGDVGEVIATSVPGYNVFSGEFSEESVKEVK